MNPESLREFSLALRGVTEELPFGPDLLVFKVMGKVFLLMPLDENKLSFNVKCAPEKAIEQRDQYTDICPGYHMNKKHWNTVYVTGNIPSELLFSLVQDSYELVVAGLPKLARAALNNQ